jgi:cellulose biosynthesis protein BcsQ
MASMGHVAALVNQKGGVGKTTVTLGLASAAAAARATVLVVDLDPQGSSTWVLGVDPYEVRVSTAEVLDTGSAVEAVVTSSWAVHVDVVPSSPRLLTHEQTPAQRLADALADLVDDYDAILIDCPPSLGGLTTNGLTAADLALIVVEPSALGIRGIGAVADLVDHVWDAHNPDLDLAGVIVNKVPAVSSEADRCLDELVRFVGRGAIWEPAIPLRVIVNEAIGARLPLHSYGARALGLVEVFDALWQHLDTLGRGSG